MTGGRALFLVALSLPFLALIVQAMAWLHWGVDVPFVDDWRMFRQGDAGSLALADLFRPANDTIYATGKLLDALAVKWLGFDTVGYQFLSMLACLGALLVLQYRLLHDAFADKWLVAAAFMANLFVLQPGSYWGYQSIAYHQALPLVALLACLTIQLSERLSCGVRIGLIATFGTLGGLAYISGAFAFAVATGVSAMFSLRASPALRSRLRSGTIGFAIATMISLPVQLWVILVVQHGGTHRTDAGWALPWQSEFWGFVLGMVSHAFAIQTPGPAVTAAILASGLLLLGLAIPALGALLRLAARTSPTQDDRQADYIYTSLFAAVGTYVFMVAAGRTALAPGTPAEWSDYFIRGGVRFHYFWIAILIPWALAIWLRPLCRAFASTSSWRPATLVLATGILAFGWHQGAISYFTYYQKAAETKSIGLGCIQAKLGSGEPVICPAVHPADMSRALMVAREVGASFTRQLEFPDAAVLRRQ